MIFLGKDTPIPTCSFFCTIAIIIRLIRSLGFTSKSPMANKPGFKYYGISHWPAENGLDYDREIDLALFNVLSSSSVISSGELKRKIEGILNRRINRQTFYNHLKMLVKDGLLNKQDTGERGKQSVFYSLTDETKRRTKLHLLRTDPQYALVKHLYAHLIFKHLSSESGTSTEVIKSRAKELLPGLRILLKDGLIKPSTKKKYIIADKALFNLVADICELDKLCKSQGKSLIILGYQSQAGYPSNNKEEVGYDIIDAINRIKKKHQKTLNKYSFLSDVIQIFCPFLFPQLPYREFWAV